MKQQHDYQYISKNDPKVKEAYKIVMQLLNEVHLSLKPEYTFQDRIVGSYSRNMITFDAKGNVGFDLDINIYPNDDEHAISPKRIKLKFKEALDKFGPAFGFDAAEDSTRVLTIKIKDCKKSRILFSVDFCFVNDFDEDGFLQQEYIRFNKKQHSYEWVQQPKGYLFLQEKVQWIKDYGLWQEVREKYIEKKNKNNDPNVHSRTIFAITIHEVCQQNGYYLEEEWDC